jgi:anti-sigma regulatory factor (Ser/Thr protein kinase)
MRAMTIADSRFSVRLASGDTVSEHARAALTGGLNGSLPERRSDLQLLVSELVTNAVAHGVADDRGEIEMRVDHWTDGVRVEVLDCGAGFDFDPGRPQSDAETSWGLFLVDRISDRWGADVDGGRTRVWFELDAA